MVLRFRIDAGQISFQNPDVWICKNLASHLFGTKIFNGQSLFFRPGHLHKIWTVPKLTLLEPAIQSHVILMSFKADTLFWQMSIDHNMYVQYQRSTSCRPRLGIHVAAMLHNVVFHWRVHTCAIDATVLLFLCMWFCWDSYRALLGHPSGCRSSTII